MIDQSISLEDAKNMFDKAKARRQNWDSEWEEVYEYVLPQREIFSQMLPGENRTDQIFDDTAVNSIQKYASRRQSALTPPFQKWAKISHGPNRTSQDQVEYIENQDIATLAEYNDSVSDILFSYINDSNIATEVYQAYLDLGISTGALLLQRGELGGPALHFDAVPLAQLYLMEGIHGVIDTVFWEKKIKGINLAREYTEVVKSDPALESAIESRQNEDFTVIDASFTRVKEGFFKRVIWETSTNCILFEETKMITSYAASPWIIFRETVTPGEVYGRGPAMRTKATIKMANYIKELILLGATYSIQPLYFNYMDNDINVSNSYDLVPGTMIPANPMSQRQPLELVERPQQFQFAEALLSDLRQDIKIAFEGETLPDVNGAVRSATEIEIRQQQLMQEIGSTARLQRELTFRIIERSLYILDKELGVIPKAKFIETGEDALGEKINGRDVKIEFQSPVTRSQNYENLQNLIRADQVLAEMFGELKTSFYNIPETVEYIRENGSIEQELIRDKNELQKALDAAQQMAMQQVAGMQQNAQGGPAQ
jgi:hypothetical protein